MKSFGMFTLEGDQLVFRIVQATIKMLNDGDFTKSEAYDFVIRKLMLLSNSDDFREADDTAVRENVLSTIDRGYV